MHAFAFAFAMCAIRTPAKTWGRGTGDGDREDSAQARRNGTQNPHIDQPGVDPLIQCWEEMDREQSQKFQNSSSEP